METIFPDINPFPDPIIPPSEWEGEEEEYE
jgi:hypothetical protein